MSTRIEFYIGKENYVIRELSIKDFYSIKTQLLIGGNESELKIVSALSGCPLQSLRKIPYDKWEDISWGLQLMLKGVFDPGKKILNKFSFSGIDYGLVDLNQLTIGEFSDLDIIVTSENADSKLHEIMAILYRPIISKKWNGYKIEEYDYDGFKERCQLFIELPLDYVQTITPFFLRTVLQSINHIKIFSKWNKNLKKEEREITEMSQKILSMLQEDGTSSLSSSPEKMYLKLLELQNLALQRLSTSWDMLKNKPRKPSWKISKWFTNITA